MHLHTYKTTSKCVDDIHTYIFPTLPTGLPNVRYSQLYSRTIRVQLWNQGSKSALSGKLSYTITTTKFSRWHPATKNSDKKPGSGIHLSGSMKVVKYVPPKKMIYPLTGLQQGLLWCTKMNKNYQIATWPAFAASQQQITVLHCVTFLLHQLLKKTIRN